MRYTRKDVQACFKRLCALLNKPIATRWNDVGTWDLDYNPTYGGWVVTEVSNAAGGISHPLGDGRVGPREFCERVWFAERVIDALDLDEEARERACLWEHVIPEKEEA